MSIRVNASIGTAEWDKGVTKMQQGLNNLQSSGARNFTAMASGFNQMSSAAVRSEAGLRNMTKAANDNSRALSMASGANANLVSQFNDIAVMLAAGQNPLQLAMQQGTQISQVLTGMGGGVGALKALGSAFIGMINPISLATIGVIGFGAAAVQWLMPAKEEAKETKTAFEQLQDSMKNYNSALGKALLYTGESEKEYGEEARRGAELARRILEAEAVKTQKSVAAIIGQAYSNLGFDAEGDRGIDGAGAISSANQSYGAESLGFKSDSMSESLLSYGGLSAEKLEIANQIGEALREINGYLTQEIPEGMGIDAYLTGLQDRLIAFRAQMEAAVVAGAGKAEVEAILNSIVEVETQLLTAQKQRADIRAADEAKAFEMLATMNQQADMAALILKYGEDSVQVRQAEALAEHNKLQAAIDALNITDELRSQLEAAADANYEAESATIAWANAMADVKAQIAGIAAIIASIGGGMISNAEKFTTARLIQAGQSRADAEKQVLYDRQDMELAAAQANNRAQYGDIVGGGLNWALEKVHNGNRNADEQLADAYELDAARVKAERDAAKGSGGGGGRGRKPAKSDAQKYSEREAKKEAEYVKNLKDNIEELRVTMGMTAEQEAIWKAQRDAGVLGDEAGMKAIEQLAKEQMALQDQKKALEENRNSWNQMGLAAADALSSMISGTESFADAMKNLIKVIANQALTNLFTNMMGGGGFSFKFPSFSKHADGGVINSAMQMVGERGPELVSLPKNSRVHTAQQTSRMMGNNSGANISMKVYTDGTARAEIIDEATKKASTNTEAALKTYDSTLPDKMRYNNRNPRMA